MKTSDGHDKAYAQPEEHFGSTYRAIGEVRFLGNRTDFNPLLKHKIFDWQSVTIYEVPSHVQACERIGQASQLGRLTSVYEGRSGFGVNKILTTVLLPNSNYVESAVDFIKNHASACPLCWNTFWQTRSYYDRIEASRNVPFSGRWCMQVLKNGVVGIAAMYALDVHNRKRR